jgi:hypothetical protein
MAELEEPQVVEPQVDPNAPPPEGEEPESNGDDSPYASLAKDMGWMPKDQFQGPPEEWKDAETFIRSGRDIQRETSREVKGLRTQLDTIAKTNATIVEQQVKERVDQLTAQYTKAVEDGDATAAFKLSREIDTTLASTQPSGSRTPSPEAQAFAERNSTWFNKPGNEYATARAVELCNMLAAQGYTDEATQLRIAEQRLEQEMPQLFGQGMNGKPAPGVNAPGSRTAGPSNREKGWADMPLESQKALEGLLERNPGITKEQIARNYFANLERKA